MPGGLITFIREQMGFPIPSPMLLPPVTQAFRKLLSSTPKTKDWISWILPKQKMKTKTIWLGRTWSNLPNRMGGADRESSGKGAGLQRTTKDHGTKVWFEYSRQRLFVTYYYFYILDEDFGLFFIKVCTYFPFDIKVCFNGHECANNNCVRKGLFLKLCGMVCVLRKPGAFAKYLSSIGCRESPGSFRPLGRTTSLAALA